MRNSERKIEEGEGNKELDRPMYEPYILNDRWSIKRILCNQGLITMSETIHIDIPDDILERYHDIGNMTRKAFEDIILMERHQGNISLGRAAEILGITYNECYDLLVSRGLPVANVSTDEQNESYKRFKSFMTTYQKP